MSARIARLVAFILFTLTTMPLWADCVGDCIDGVTRDFKRRNCWPAPFVCPDRQAARAPFAVMVANGWRRQNLLGDFHFEAKNGQLTEAGKLKIRWIVYESPEQHRAVFVHIGKDNEETMSRLAAVQAYAATLVPQDEIPPIMQTSISDGGSPADRIDQIERKYQSTTPAPRLAAPGGGGSGGGGGGGGGGN
jgi:hypothetical protein